MSTHKSLGYFGTSFDSTIVSEPKQRYAIYSSQRTGSNYLCSRLGNVDNQLGNPMEYLNDDAIQAFGPRLFPGDGKIPGLKTYVDAVARLRTSSDGWFGTKIQPGQLFAMTGGNLDRAIKFLQSFDRLIFMTRRDKLRQAISGAIAKASGEWLNFGKEPKLEGIETAKLFPLILKLQLQYIEEDNMIELLDERLSEKPRLHIVYEDILRDPNEVFQRVVSFLGADIHQLNEDKAKRLPTEPPPGALAGRIREAYLKNLGKKYRIPATPTSVKK